MRGFEVANKIVDGEVVGKWDVVSLPVYATKKAAGADFFAAEDVKIPSIWSRMMSSGLKDTTRLLSSELKSMFGDKNPLNIQDVSQDDAKKVMEPTLVHTGIKAYMEDDEVLYIFNRSGNPKKLGLVLANSVGVIDSDYYGNVGNDGEIMFAFYNFFPFDITIHKGDKIGQGVFQKFLRADNAVVGDVVREGGFGSTGVSLTKEMPSDDNVTPVTASGETGSPKMSLAKGDEGVKIDQPLKASVQDEIKEPIDTPKADGHVVEYSGVEGLGALDLK